MVAALTQIAGLVVVNVGAWLAAGVGGGLVAAGVTAVFVGVAAERGA